MSCVSGVEECKAIVVFLKETERYYECILSESRKVALKRREREQPYHDKNEIIKPQLDQTDPPIRSH
jgi:hypothetical protein